MHRTVVLVVFATAAGVAPVAALQQQAVTPAQVGRLDSLFARFAGPDGPGCALGVSRRDSIVLERAWGLADLEHGVPITPVTVFEGGSVSKQFTAAAVLLLAQQGRLSLDDDVRRWVPEVPGYGDPITLRHLLHHVSGLRDWGAVAALGGWPRGTRTYTHAHVLQIVARQRGLNNAPGAEYLYSNSNYNLLAIVAERASGRSLADFTREHLFAPLGMTRSGWRDDYTRIVPGRAQAYGPAGSGRWRLVMPFENVYGNSSVLVTVGDLLRWDAGVAAGRVGGPALAAQRLARGRLRGGYEIAYAAGVFVREYAGTREIAHDGATAGYRAFLGRYPDEGWSVALLCNTASANPSGLGHAVFEILSGRRPEPPPSDTVGIALAPDRLAALAGQYVSDLDHTAVRFQLRDGRLRVPGAAAPVVMRSDSTFEVGRATAGTFARGPDGRVAHITMTAGGDTVVYRPAAEPLGGAALAAYAGTYRSDEADVTVSVVTLGDRVAILRPPADTLRLTGTYRDGFSAGGITVRFTRAGGGAVDGFGMTVTRARHVRFARVDSPPAPR